MASVVMDPCRLRHFIEVAECSSFTRAAAALHLSQQALSSSVRLLGADVGTALFRREGRRITLTAAGETLAREARPFLAAARTLRHHVRHGGRGAWMVGHTPGVPHRRRDE